LRAGYNFATQRNPNQLVTTYKGYIPPINTPYLQLFQSHIALIYSVRDVDSGMDEHLTLLTALPLANFWSKESVLLIT
jgi:hypothetical protein